MSDGQMVAGKQKRQGTLGDATQKWVEPEEANGNNKFWCGQRKTETKVHTHPNLLVAARNSHIIGPKEFAATGTVISKNLVDTKISGEPGHNSPWTLKGYALGAYQGTPPSAGNGR